MNRCLSLILGASLFIGGAARAADSPFIGEWKLDPSRTRVPDEMKVENISGNKYAFDFGGGAETILVDGTDQPAGGDTTLAVSVRGPSSWMVVRKKDGRRLLRAIWTLSKDGRTLTDDFTLIAPDGSGSTVHNRYKRTAGTSGFSGTWENTTMRTASGFVVQVKPYEEDGLSFIYPSLGITKNMKFDGKDRPKVGASVPPGSVFSARLVNEHALEVTDKYDDKTVDTQDISVSPDRKTLTITVRYPRQRLPTILVLERQ